MTMSMALSYQSTHSMARLPIATNAVTTALYASGVAKYVPGYVKPIQAKIDIPQVNISTQQLADGMKINSGLRAPSNGMFKTNRFLMMSRQQAADILGVDRNADEKAIKTAYKQAAKKSHPDTGGSNEKMQNISEAKNTLLLKSEQSVPITYSSSGYEPKPEDFTPEQKLPKGNWNYVGTWKKTVITPHQEPGWFFREAKKPETIYWTRNLIDQDGELYIQRAELQYRYSPELINETFFNFAIPSHITYEVDHSHFAGKVQPEKTSCDIPSIFKQQNIEFSNTCKVADTVGSFAKDLSPVGIKKARFLQEVPMMNIFTFDQIPQGALPDVQVKFINKTKGYGAIALQDIKAGTLIRPYTGEITQVYHSQIDNRPYSAHITHGEYPLIIDAEKLGNESRFFNHSYTSNMQETFAVDEHGYVQYWIKAIKDIKAGEELCWNYGNAYWRTRGIVPEEDNVRHLYQNKHVTIYTELKQGNVTLFVNDQPIIQDTHILGADTIVEGGTTYITVARIQGNDVLPTIFVQNGIQVEVLPDISMLDQNLQSKIIDSFKKAVGQAR